MSQYVHQTSGDPFIRQPLELGQKLKWKCFHHMTLHLELLFVIYFAYETKTWQRLLEEIDSWVRRPCPPIGSFIACVTMHCLVQSQPFSLSCPLLLLLQEQHQGNDCSNPVSYFDILPWKPTWTMIATFPFALLQERSNDSISIQRRWHYQS